MENKNPNDEEQKEKAKRNTFFRGIGICVFFAALFAFAVLGMIIPLRPSESALENRTLEKFPEFTLASFLSGDYFEEISTWYSDSYPFREGLLTANAGFERLYGIRGEQIIYSDNAQTGYETAEAGIDDAEAGEASEPVGEVYEPTEVITGDLFGSQDAEEEEVYEDAAIDVAPESVGNVYVTGDTAFELFYFNQNASDQFIDTMNYAQAELNGIADLYLIIAPNSCGINLTEKAQNKVHASDQDAAISYVYDGLDGNIKKVETYDILHKHNSEYLYFRTDHHWTALGAYYVYTSFCETKGITPTPLEDFETVEFPDFLGTLYSGSNQAASLRNNPDTVIAYIPSATNNITLWNSSIGEFKWNIIFDVSDYNTSEKYMCFIGGDQSFAEIDNPELNDGSSCVVIKNSYGNAFVPFLVDHYDHIYVADYRWFSAYPDYGNSILKLVNDKNIQDVIVLINTQSLVESQVAMIDAMFR